MTTNGLNLFLLIASIFEILLLQIGYMRGKVKWEGMWVIFVECVAYSAALVSPDADFVSIRLTNGMWVEWMRYAGWILTCPVLLMTLVSMTTEDGTKAPTVRLVPLLVANLTMVLLGVTAAANLQPAKWYIFAMALCFGGHVFSSAIQCFVSLIESSPTRSVRNTSIALALTFLAGWGCFPCAFLTGHSGMGIISTDVQWALFVLGDLLSKNSWVAIAVLRSHYLDVHHNLEAAQVADIEIAVGAMHGGGRQQQAPRPQQQMQQIEIERKRRGSNSSMLINEMNGPNAPKLDQRLPPANSNIAPMQSSSHHEARSKYHEKPHSPHKGLAAGAEPWGNLKAAVARDEGEAADLGVLKAVLARYHAMPLAERESLVPVFAALLTEGASPGHGPGNGHGHGPGNGVEPNHRASPYPVGDLDDMDTPVHTPGALRQQSSWLSREMGGDDDDLRTEVVARPSRGSEGRVAHMPL